MKRYKVIQSGKVVKDYFNPYERKGQAFQVVHFEYEGRTYVMADTFMNGRIRSTFFSKFGADSREYQFRDLIKKFNAKVPYPVYNIGSAKDCPSLESGECLVGEGDCYAWHDENMYKTPLYYRRRQEIFWRNNTTEEMAQLLLDHIGKVKALRFNESGDFRTLSDVVKMDKVAMYLGYYGVKCYVFTARRNLGIEQPHYAWSRKHITIIGSRIAGLDGQFNMSHDAKADVRQARALGFRAIVCPNDCSKCSVCPNQKTNPTIIFGQKH